MESLLGVQRKANTLRFAPCLPPDWQRAEVSYRYRETVYRVTIVQAPLAEAAATVTVDGVERADGAVLLVDDRREHIIEVRLSDKPRTGSADRDNITSDEARA